LRSSLSFSFTNCSIFSSVKKLGYFSALARFNSIYSFCRVAKALPTKKVDQAVGENIKELIPQAEIQKEMTTTFGIIAKWPMRDYSTEKFEQLLQKLGKI